MVSQTECTHDPKSRPACRKRTLLGHLILAAEVTRFLTVRHVHPTGGGGQPAARPHGSVLSISCSKHLAAIFGYQPTTVTAANYPDVNILSLPYPDNAFDLVLSNHVFEHIEWSPEAAMPASAFSNPAGYWCTPPVF